MRRLRFLDSLIRGGLLISGLMVLGYMVWTLTQDWLGVSRENNVGEASIGILGFSSSDLELPALAADAAQIRIPEIREPAPVFTLNTLSGSEVSLSDYQGQRVLVNFWATWCAPCRIEMPAIENSYQRYQDQNVIVLAINLAEKVDVIQPYVDELELTFPILLDANGAVAEQYLVRGLPTSIFITSDGMIYREHIGPMTEAFIEETLTEMEQNEP